MSKKILHIDSSAQTDASISRQLSADIVTKLAPSSVIRRDVASGLPFVTEAWVQANFTPPADRGAEQVELLKTSDELINELLDADILVIGVPFYNFSIPASLKAWIDLITRVGRTFRFTEDGQQIGILENKRAILAVSSGGVPVGSPADFATPLVTQLLGFIGIEDVEVIDAGQMMLTGEESLARAKSQIEALAA